MSEWPPISEPKLLDRLALNDDDFAAFSAKLSGLIPAREFNGAALTRALSYPWARPPRSYLLENDTVTLFADLSEARRQELIPHFSPATSQGGDSTRFPLLAFGSNGSPEALTMKFSALPPEDRTVIVAAGDLHDFDVGASAHAAHYGALPATIFESPGTAVRAAVLWVTAPQLNALAWTEVNYHFGRLDGIRFAQDFDAEPVTSVFAFASRIGIHSPDRQSVALEAVPAERRTAAALTQEAMLDRLATLSIGDDATASDLVRAMYEDYAGTVTKILPVLRETAKPFASERWTRF